MQKEKNKILLSFIIPVYNTDSIYLKMCIESILKIESVADEILIINDGSTKEETLELLRKYRDNKKIYIIDKENSGVSECRNIGIQESKGEYTIFVDSDDYIVSENIEGIIKILENNSDIDIFVFTHNDVDENSKIIFSGNNSRKRFICSSIFDLYEEGRRYNASFIREPVWAKVFKTDFIKSFKFNTNLKFGEDNLFMLETGVNSKKILACCETIYNYRRNQNSVTIKYNPNILNECLKNINALQSFYIENNLQEKLPIFYKDVIFRYYINLILKLNIFHKENKKNIIDKRKEAISILGNAPFNNMFKNMNKRILNKKEKIIYLCLKNKFVLAAFCIFKMKR